MLEKEVGRPVRRSYRIERAAAAVQPSKQAVNTSREYTRRKEERVLKKTVVAFRKQARRAGREA